MDVVRVPALLAGPRRGLKEIISPDECMVVKYEMLPTCGP